MCHVCARVSEEDRSDAISRSIELVSIAFRYYEPRFNTPRDDRDTYFSVHVRECVCTKIR